MFYSCEMPQYFHVLARPSRSREQDNKVLPGVKLGLRCCLSSGWQLGWARPGDKISKYHSVRNQAEQKRNKWGNDKVRLFNFDFFFLFVPVDFQSDQSRQLPTYHHQQLIHLSTTYYYYVLTTYYLTYDLCMAIIIIITSTSFYFETFPELFLTLTPICLI